MSWQAVEAVIQHSTERGALYAVQLIIAEAIIQGRTETEAQQTFLAERAHLSVSHFRRQTRILASRNQLTIGRHGRRPNTYRFPFYPDPSVRLTLGEQEPKELDTAAYSPNLRRTGTDDADVYSPNLRRSLSAYPQANSDAVPYSGNISPGSTYPNGEINNKSAHAREEPGTWQQIIRRLESRITAAQLGHLRGCRLFRLSEEGDYVAITRGAFLAPIIENRYGEDLRAALRDVTHMPATLEIAPPPETEQAL